MTVEDFRKHMNEANRRDDLCILSFRGELVIALGLDSSRGVAILHGDREVPISELEPDHD